jgi:hypothetical protein
MNQFQNSLLENPCKGDHEAGDSQKSDVGLGVPVVPGYQSSPVVYPPVAAFHLPATLAELMYQRRSTWPSAPVGPFSNPQNTLIGVEVAVGALGLAKGHVDIKRHPGVWDNSSIVGQV